MATKTLYLIDTRVASGTNNHYTTQENGTAPTDAAHSTATGWVAATSSSPQNARLASLTEISRADAEWSATLKPVGAPDATRGDAWSAGPFTGTFANTAWTLSQSVRSITAAYTGRFRFRWRVWKSANANGSSATELSSGTQVSAATTANLTTTANTTVSLSWSPGAITLSNEYVFFQLALECTTAGGGTTQDVNLRKNSAAAITTPDFSVPTTVSPTGFADTESFGTESLQLGAAPTGFADTESFGTDAAQLGVSPTGFADSEAFGTESAQLGAAPTGFAETEAFGTDTVQLSASSTGFADAESFGTPSAGAAPTNVGPTGFADTESFGTESIQLGAGPTGLAETEAFGTSVFRINVGQAGFADSEAFGTLIASDNSTTNVFPTGFADTESFGTLATQLSATPTGFTDSEGFGTSLVAILLTEVGGFAEPELFGVLSLGSVGEAAPENTLYILVENRILIVKREDRTLVIAQENRLLEVELEKRTLTISAENRELVVK